MAVEEETALSSVQAQDVSALGREQAKEATRTIKTAHEAAQSVLDRLTASFDGVRNQVADAATTSFDQGVKTLNEAIESAGMANRGGVDQAVTDQLDTARKEAQTIDQTKPENLETVAGIEAVFTRADQAVNAAKTLSDATTAVHDGPQPTRKPNRLKARADTNQHTKATATTVAMAAVATTPRTLAAMVVVTCAAAGRTAITQTSPNGSKIAKMEAGTTNYLKIVTVIGSAIFKEKYV